MLVKICGITRPEDAAHAARFGADYVGLIRAPGPRTVATSVAGTIAKSLPATTRPVLVYRDAAIPDILSDVAETGIASVQLHGLEGAQFIAKLRHERPDLRVIKAWPIENDASATSLTNFVTRMQAANLPLEFIILDTPKDGANPTFERMGRIAKRALSNWPPLWLAGGLSLENLAGAVSHGVYVGVDVARGVETAPGLKDALLIERFIAAAKRL